MARERIQHNTNTNKNQEHIKTTSQKQQAVATTTQIANIRKQHQQIQKRATATNN